MNPETPAAEPEPRCPHCGKVEALCLCGTVSSLPNRVFVLFLQHPQEQDRELGTAQLARTHFQNADLKTGLSWPNISKAVGRDVDPSEWAVLYLGPAAAAGQAASAPQSPAMSSPVTVFDRHGKALSPANGGQVLSGLEGIILLDGSWSQAKTLWWRNPWLLKCWRIVLTPKEPSLYGRIRREPRRESLSTLEAAAIVMTAVENDPEIKTRLFSSFRRLLQQYRSLRSETSLETIRPETKRPGPSRRAGPRKTRR